MVRCSTETVSFKRLVYSSRSATLVLKDLDTLVLTGVSVRLEGSTTHPDGD